MTAYVWGTSLSYRDYLQARSFIAQLADGSAAIRLEVASGVRALVASQQELSSQQVALLESIDSNTETIALGLETLSSQVTQLGQVFHWGFSTLSAQVGALAETLEELLSLARSPAQAWAYNQYEIARDAVRRQLYPEALEALDRAIGGYGSNTGYKLDFRFHKLKGLLQLGDIGDTDATVLDLPAARGSLLLAARYAQSDHPREAADCLLGAAWSAYCVGDAKEAIESTRKAIGLQPSHPDGHFQLAKFLMHTGCEADAIAHLAAAVDVNPLYALKCSADGDFLARWPAVDAFLQTKLQRSREEFESHMAVARQLADEIKKLLTKRGWGSAAAKKAIELVEQAEGLASSGTLIGVCRALSVARMALPQAQKAHTEVLWGF